MNGKKVLGIILAIIVLLVIIIGMIISLLNKPTYMVSFDSDGGTLIKTQEVKAQEKVKKPVNPTKDGYIFDAWYLEDEEFDFDTKIVGNITLKAKWLKETPSYTISFDTLGGEALEQLQIFEGEIVSEIPVPSKEGYTFIGWYYQNQEFDFTKPISQDIILVAKWEKNTTSVMSTSYVVSFDTDGGSSINSQTIKEGGLVLMPQNPTKEGFAFDGWYYNNEEFDFKTKITNNITLVAKWVEAPSKDSTISYVLEDVSGSVVGQAKLYITFNGEKVSGTLDITSISGKTKTVDIPKEGYEIQKNVIASISNIQVR